ncbi:MAG: plasmid mobilization protein [Porcipelethomonas sp.]
MKVNKKQTIQFRVTESEKSEIERRAQIMGTKTSTFLRELAVAPDKITVLEKGQEIAAALTEIQIDLRTAIRCQRTDNLSEVILLKKLDDISAMFAEIIDSITVFKPGEEEDDDNVNT